MGQILAVLRIINDHNCDLIAVVDDVSLFPPQPPMYEITRENDKYVGTFGFCFNEMDATDGIEMDFIDVEKDNKVCLMHYKSKTSQRVVIYSHGNATDLGCCVPYMLTLGSELDTDYIYYDYEGYGRSSGSPKSCNLIRDLSAVYDYTCKLFPKKNIYLCGESIGSVPTAHFAANLWKQYKKSKKNGGNSEVPLAGVILHSALYSGSTSFPCGCLISGRDPYNNASIVKGIRCPIFHIHGSEDEIIPFSMGKKLYTISESTFEPWWVEGASHGNIISEHTEEYCQKMKQFFSFCETKI